MSASLPRRDFLIATLLAGTGSAIMPARAQRTDRQQVDVRLLGTGASDHDWKRLGEPDVRGSTSTLIDGRVLIDCGRTGRANLERSHVAPDALTDLVITHSHGDHFDINQIREVLDARAAGLPLPGIWASAQALVALRRQLDGRFVGHALTSGMSFDLGRLHATALPANHLLPDPAEQAFHFLIETPRGNLLYALDGAWQLKPARQLIGRTRLDMIIWDATMSETGDYRIFEHNDLAMIGLMMQSLKTTRAVHDRTVCVLDHIARTLWPADLKQSEKLASDRGWILAADGMSLRLASPPS